MRGQFLELLNEQQESELGMRRELTQAAISPLYLPHISRISPVYLPYVSSACAASSRRPRYLPYISRISPVYLPYISRISRM